MVRSFFIALGAAILLPASSSAQQPTPGPARRDTWTAEMSAGDYIVRLSSITAVSMHEYVVDGAARVTEVNVDTTGSSLVRFYYIEPNVPKPSNGVGQSTIQMLQDKAVDAMDRVGVGETWKKVSKNYPTTTHARTVEYRLDSLETLRKLFESVKNSWLNDRPAIFKP